MRTKRLFILCGLAGIALFTSITTSAQIVVEEQIAVAELVPGKVHYYSESSLNNWYLSLGAGTQTFLTEHSGSDPRFTLAMNLAAGKWFTPDVGMRISAMGGSLHFNWQEGEGSMKYGALYFDFMWNMMNTFGGYNEERVFSIIPFIGLGGAYGWHHTGNDDKTYSMPVSGGLKLNFRLSHYVDFFIEMRAQAVGDQFNHVIRGSQIETALSAVGGFSFKFRQDRFRSYDPYANQLAIAALNRRTNELRAQLDACNSRQVECPPCPEVTETETIVIEQTPCTGTITASVSFAINSSTVSPREMVNVYNVAQWLKDNPSCSVTITGYADRDTGSSDYNMKLSRKRAEAVAHLLTSQYGIANDRITIVGEGSSEQPFPKNNDWNRIVIFTGGN